MNLCKNEHSLVNDLLVIFLVEALGITQNLYKQEIIENLVNAYGNSITKEQIKKEFDLNAEQELQIGMILHPALKIPASEDWTRVIPLAEEATVTSEGKTLVLQLAA